MKRLGFALLLAVAAFVGGCTKAPPKSEWYAELRISGPKVQVVLWASDSVANAPKLQFWLTLESISVNSGARRMFESSISPSLQRGSVVIDPNLQRVRVEFEDVASKSMGGDFPVKFVTGDPFFIRKND
jgi:hypothetical protein